MAEFILNHKIKIHMSRFLDKLQIRTDTSVSLPDSIKFEVETSFNSYVIDHVNRFNFGITISSYFCICGVNLNLACNLVS